MIEEGRHNTRRDVVGKGKRSKGYLQGSSVGQGGDVSEPGLVPGLQHVESAIQ